MQSLYKGHASWSGPNVPILSLTSEEQIQQRSNGGPQRVLCSEVRSTVQYCQYLHLFIHLWQPL